MKFSNESSEAKRARQAKWHTWFAWYPVRVGDNDFRWLETVQRKIAYGLAKNRHKRGRAYLPRFTSSYDNPDVQGFRSIKF